MKNPRRLAFLAWFQSEYKGDDARARFMADTGLTKGRVSQLFDENQPFGERAAIALAIRLRLDEDTFLRPPENEQGAIEAATALLERLGVTRRGQTLAVKRPVWVVGRGSGSPYPDRVWTDGDHPVGMTDQFAELNERDQHAFLVKVVGQSMFPAFKSGHFALIRPGAPIEVNDEVLVRLTTGQSLLKILKGRRGDIWLGSYNDAEELNFRPDEVTWMYRAVYAIPPEDVRDREERQEFPDSGPGDLDGDNL